MVYSRYNIKIKNNKDFIIYNTFTNAVVELSPIEYRQMLKSVRNNKSTPLTDSLIQQGILVETNNELDIIKYNFKCMQYDNLNLSLTICPTMDCIFRCPYCFESRKNGKMSVENQNKLIEFVKEHIKNSKAMDVMWFGGEPLMAFDVIENLSEAFMRICKENNVEYTAYIISNGYLLDKEKVEKFVKYNIKGIQITIDGPKEVHDTRRVLEGNKGTYDKIVENIKFLQNYDIRVNIRVNIDKTNNLNIENLFKDFEEKGLTKVKFDFGHVIDYTENCRAISCNCLTKQQFSKTIMHYSQILKKYNFPRNHKSFLPEPISIYCDAEKMYAYNLDHELNLYKCWNEIGNPTNSIGKLGDINRTEKQRANERKYILWNPFETKKCSKCKYLPLCMGGCPYLGLKTHKNQCDKWKFVINNMLKEYVEKNEQ